MASRQDKDWWDKAQVIFSVLTPIAVVGIGIWFNYQMALRADAHAQQQDRLSRLALIPPFMDALTGTDAKKQLLAVRTINAILPEDGVVLLAGIAQANAPLLSTEAKETVQNATNLRVVDLVNQIFAPALETRISAYRSLALGFDPNTVVPTIVQTGLQNSSNENGVFNTLTFLNSAPPDVLRQNSDAITQLAIAAKKNGSKTEALANQVIDRMK